MKTEKSKTTILEEVAALKSKFDQIKKDTEEFVESAKHLSDSGVREAKGLIDLAKQNWQGLLSNFSGSILAQFFAKGKSSSKNKASVPKAKTVAKAAIKKVVKKVTKNTKRKK
jgi:hypothetical protein